MTRYAWIGLFVIATATACDLGDFGPQYCEGDWAAAAPEAEPPRARAQTVAQVLPAESSAVDILFVIDDSPSMADEQAQLGIWSSKLFDVLSGSGELPDLHIAATAAPTTARRTWSRSRGSPSSSRGSRPIRPRSSPPPSMASRTG